MSKASQVSCCAQRLSNRGHPWHTHLSNRGHPWHTHLSNRGHPWHTRPSAPAAPRASAYSMCVFTSGALCSSRAACPPTCASAWCSRHVHVLRAHPLLWGLLQHWRRCLGPTPLRAGSVGIEESADLQQQQRSAATATVSWASHGLQQGMATTGGWVRACVCMCVGACVCICGACVNVGVGVGVWREGWGALFACEHVWTSVSPPVQCSSGPDQRPVHW